MSSLLGRKSCIFNLLSPYLSLSVFFLDKFYTEFSVGGLRLHCFTSE